MTKSNLPTGVTQAQIDAWKEKHGKVQLATFDSAVGKCSFILGQPTRDILDAWSKYNNNDDLVKSRKVLESGCILHGNTELFSKDVCLQNSVHRKIVDMLEIYQAEEKEL